MNVPEQGSSSAGLANDKQSVRPSAKEREEAWERGRIVWVAKWHGRTARIVSMRPVPGWIHEGGNEVKWKVIEGEEYL